MKGAQRHQLDSEFTHIHVSVPPWMDCQSRVSRTNRAGNQINTRTIARRDLSQHFMPNKRKIERERERASRAQATRHADKHTNDRAKRPFAAFHAKQMPKKANQRKREREKGRHALKHTCTAHAPLRHTRNFHVKRTKNDTGHRSFFVLCFFSENGFRYGPF